MPEAPRSSLLGAYRTATAVLAPPLSPLILAWRVRRGKEDPSRSAERRGIASCPRPDGPVIWIHAASVGETVSVLPMIDRLLATAGISVLLTTGTVTSTRIARARLGDRAIHQYVPHDGPGFARRFLNHWRPGLAIFVESELWPNLIVETALSGARLALVNARMSDRSFRRWLKRPAMIAAMLARFDLCLAQSEGDAERLAALGARPVVNVGNLKYDVPAPAAEPEELARLASVLEERPVWAAASVHPGEYEAALDVHAALQVDYPDLLTILAPRHPDLGPEIEQAAAGDRGLKVALRSRGDLPVADAQIYVFDTIGDMGLAYRLTRIVFMGGSLVPHGGQNPIEPAKLETAILHGPNVHNFEDVYAALHAAEAADEVADAPALAARVSHLLASPGVIARRAEAANAAVVSFSGALDRSMAALEPLIAAAKEA